MRVLLFLLLALLSGEIRAQKPVTLTFTNDDYKVVKKNIPLTFKDSISAINYLKELRYFAISKGYLTASVDSIYYSHSAIKASFYTGEKFTSVTLNVKSEDQQFIRKNAGFSEKTLTNISFRPGELERFMYAIQTSLVDNGFPFAQVSLANIHYQGMSLLADLKVNKGEFYEFKTIHIKGDSSVSETYINSLIGIKSGDVFDESKLKTISSKIAQVSFLKEIKPFELLFLQDGVDLYLYLKSSPVSSANGTIGLQQNATTGKVTLTGDLSLKLLNILHKGELLNFAWKSIQDQTQSMNINLNYPFLFKSPFGLDGQFQLYKRDSTFLELNTSIGVQYLLKGGNYLKAFYKNYTSSLLSGADNSTTYSNLANVNSNSYGIALYRQVLDYVPNPSRGFSMYIETAVGSRVSQTSDTAAKVRSTTVKSTIRLEYFLPLAKRHVLRLLTNSEQYYAPEIYENEEYRFGGLTTLRGFNEQELYATTLTVLSVEYRFLADKNSHAFAFFDQAFYENRADSYYKDHPYGFGAGFAFGTKAGIFSISYALGSQMNNPILMKNGKVHFGYISYF